MKKILMLLCFVCYIASAETGNETIQSRYSPPVEYNRVKCQSGSFGAFLQSLRLKPIGSPVRYYDGRQKQAMVHEAVVDLPIGRKNLHQCADAVIRLHAEWLYSQKKYGSISYDFTNGFRADYTKWKEGQRIRVDGNKVSWVPGSAPSNDLESFWKYLETVFSYAGTLSLSKSLKSKNLADMAIGDVLIQGGSPGHAVIIVDMAVNSKGDKLYMLAQSYMPAQEIQILKNQKEKNISPWYRLTNATTIDTPEWIFSMKDLKSF